ncbi:unnamed protein product [Owenia fusiformis]|uniref:Glycosyltransferase n=1 Tax=Owenia fusiformis TaxID=6347 RepID=A0A8S4MVJ8_OWEFU|nr:unnamed protein product [Owenia fusiformis]
MTELTIFGFVPRRVEHMSDFLRIHVLQEHGGIYIDNDILALKSIEPLRHYDHTQGIGLHGDGLSNGAIIAKKESILFNLWIEAYRTYKTFGKSDIRNNIRLWGYYSIHIPRMLLTIYPHLVHIESQTLIKPKPSVYMDKRRIKYVWENNYSIHVWQRLLTVPDSPEKIPDLPSESLLRQAMEYIWFDRKPLDMA